MTKTEAFEMIWSAAGHIASQCKEYGEHTEQSIYDALNILNQSRNQLSREIRNGQ